jgi:glycosyltransferase involved in cell wall biosynthesis
LGRAGLCYDLARVRILLDYRPALRHRTGVGEYVHRLATALAGGALAPPDTLTLFSSSLSDRLAMSQVPGATQVDAQVPVRVLNLLWHRLEWPPADWFAGPVDLTHSMHPILMPARRAVQFVTVHDLYFLDRPGDTHREIRRDYARLAPLHARRADRVVVISHYTKGLVESRLGVPAERIVVCPPGAPDWPARDEPESPGPILFVGTIEPRKNVPGLLAAYAELLARHPSAPPLVLAGKLPPEGLGALPAGVPANQVHARGYVSDQERRELYRRCSLLVMPSLDEGFGIPALEAMTAGVPVVVANRGALPEVVADAGLLVDPADPAAIAAAMERVLLDDPLRRRMAAAGIERSREYNWDWSARHLAMAYAAAWRERGGAS